MESIKEIIQKIEENNLKSSDLDSLVVFLEKYSSTRNKERITVDDVNKAKIIKLFLKKYEELTGEWISISGEDWKKQNLSFSKIKFIVDDLEMNRVIAHKLLSIGGNIDFELVEHQLYLDFMYEEVLGILNKFKELVSEKELKPTQVKLTKEEEGRIQNSAEKVEERKALHIQRLISSFKSFVERDGWLAFWERSSVKNELKSDPEEIARSQLMAYLTAIEIDYGGSSYREIPEGAGRADVLRLNVDGSKVIFELKIYRDNPRFQEGKIELISHMEKEKLEEGFYLVFDPRQNKDNLERSIVENGKKLHIYQIHIYQQPPTKKK